MAEQDLCIKKLLLDKTRFADFYNGILFGREQVLKPELLELIPSESGIVITDQSGGKRTVQRRRDVVMQVSKSLGMCFAVLACEGQSNVHYGMPVRAMMYDALDYAEQVESIGKQHQISGDLSGAEFLSRIKKGDRLVPVVTVILYYGKQEWDAPMSLYEMLDLDRLPRPASSVQDYISDYRLNLVDIKNIKDTGVFQSSLQQIFDMVKYNSDKEILYQYVREQRNKLRQMDQDAMTALLVLLGEQKRLMKLMEEIKEQEEFDMCQAIDELIEDGRKEGRKEGIEVGMEQLLTSFLRKDSSVRHAVEMLGVSESLVIATARKKGIEVVLES